MTFVCLALVAALVTVTVALTGVLARQQRAHARREDLLINQLLHATGKPWTPSPDAEAGRARDDAAREERATMRYTASPEQQPID